MDAGYARETNLRTCWRTSRAVTIAGEPRHAISFNIATLPWSTDHRRYFILMTDLFSEFVELYPKADQTAESVRKCLLQGYRHGPPKIMLSDQERMLT